VREFGDAVGGHDQLRMEEHIEEAELEVVYQEGGAMAVESIFIGELVIVRTTRVEYRKVHREM
jgi:hypothetical protein